MPGGRHAGESVYGIGISIGPPKVELGEWAVQGTCVVVHQLLPASSGGDQQPRANRAAGIRHGQGHQPARAIVSCDPHPVMHVKPDGLEES